MSKYPMNPDKFQMKDIKRRLTQVEGAHKRLLARYDRMILKGARKDIELALLLEEFQAHLAAVKK